MLHLGQSLPRVLGEDLNVLRGVLVGKSKSLVQPSINNDDLSERLPGHPCDVCSAERCELALNREEGSFGDRFAGGDEDGGRIGTVLGLREEVRWNTKGLFSISVRKKARQFDEESDSLAQVNGSAASSATMRTSVGPAKRSIPTGPKRARLASAAKAFPGPARKWHCRIDSVPSAIAC